MNNSSIKDMALLYRQYKKILDVVLDSDDKSLFAISWREVLSIEDIEHMRDYITRCKDIGIHLIVRDIN